MLRPSRKLFELDRIHTKERLGERTWSEALAVFAAMWREAVALNPEFPGDWRDDLAPDFAIARAVNGLPPGT